MTEKYLTLDQNLCAARIFLNTFGLTLENIDTVDEFSTVKIFNKTKEVGTLHFSSGKVIIEAKYNNGTLLASYEMAFMSGFVDRESNNALFGQWSSNIEFEIQDLQGTQINGKFLLTNAIDSQFGISCNCHPLLTLNIPGKGDITLKMLRDGCVFYFEFNTENYNETIEFKAISEYIRHDIKKGEYNEERYQYPYRKYVGVFNAAEVGEDKDKLNMFLKEEQGGNILNYRRDLVKKVNKDNYRKMNIQRGLLMQQLDSDMLEKVQTLREILTIDGVSILDNLISVCYDSYTDEELVALLGTKRPTLVYQDGSESLKNAYYGIGKNDLFLPLEGQKSFLK